MTDFKIQQAIDRNLSAMHVLPRHVNQIMESISEGKKVKKKLSVVLVMTLIFILLAATALAVTVLAGRQRVLNAQGDPQPLSCAVQDETLYIMTNRGLMTWQEENTAPVTLMNDQALMAIDISIDSMLFQAEELSLLDPHTGVVWAYAQGAFTRVMQLDTAELPLQDVLLSDPVYRKGFLFIRTARTDELEEDAAIYRISLTTGDVRRLPVIGVIALTAYRDGELLAIKRQLPDLDAVIVIDPQSGEEREQITSVQPLSLKGLAYDTERDALCGVYNGMLSVWENGQWSEKQPVTLPISSFFYSVLRDGFVTASFNGIQFVDFTADTSAPVLRICGLTDGLNMDDEYAAAHPEIQIQRETKTRFSGQEVKEAIAAGDTTDLFYVRIDADTVALMRTGQLVSLAESGTLAADAAQMLPQIRRAISWEGKLYALADELYLPVWMIRADATAAPPTTVLELLRQDAAWNATPQQPTAFLANDYNTKPWTKTDYARYALQQYIMEAEAAGNPPDFSAECFTAFLESLKNAVLSETEFPAQRNVITANASFLLQGLGDADIQSQWKWMKSPTVGENEPDRILASLYAYVVNPHGANREAAIAYLEYAAAHRSASMRALLSPATATPSLYAYAQDDDNDQTLPESWEVSAQALEEYRTNVAPLLDLMLSPLLATPSSDPASGFGGMLKAIQAYLQGDTTLDACVTELNRSR